MTKNFRSKHSVPSVPPMIFPGCLPSQRRQLQFTDRCVEDRFVLSSDRSKMPDELDAFIEQDVIKTFDELT